MTAALSPDCAVGKHPACNEDAWDFDRDAIAVCPCDCHGWVCPNCGDRMPPWRTSIIPEVEP